MTALPAAVVFDFDGLILDTETSSFTTAAEVFADHGVELSRDWWLSIIGTAEHPHWSEVLEARREKPLKSRAVIKIGEVDLTFYLAADLYGALGGR